MYTHSLFDSFFAPTRIIVVSEERLKAAERKSKEDELTAVEVRLTEITKYRDKLKGELEPQSLEEALLVE